MPRKARPSQVRRCKGRFGPKRLKCSKSSAPRASAAHAAGSSRLVPHHPVSSRLSGYIRVARADNEAILKRAAFLAREDRLLVELLIRGNTSRRKIAEILGLEPGTVSRRIQRLGKRLHDPLVVALVDDRCPLTPEYRQLGIEAFLQGLTTPDLAEKHQMPAARVRRILDFLRGWHRGMLSAYRRNV